MNKVLQDELEKEGGVSVGNPFVTSLKRKITLRQQLKKQVTKKLSKKDISEEELQRKSHGKRFKFSEEPSN